MMSRLDCDQVDWVLRSTPLERLSEEQFRAIEEHLGDCALCRESWKAANDRKFKFDGPPEKVYPHDPDAPNSAKGQGAKRLRLKFFVLTALLLLFIAAFHVFGLAREAARRADSQAAMKQFGLIFKKYADESKYGNWPALASIDGLWVPELEPLRALISSNTKFMVSVYHPENTQLKGEIREALRHPPPDFDRAAQIFGESFAYFGYTVQSEAEFEALWQARTQHAILPDWTVPSTILGSVLPLREGVGRLLVKDINGADASSKSQSHIPVLVEIAAWKFKKSESAFKGANVLYMDGHVAFVPLGTFPVLPSILDALSGS